LAQQSQKTPDQNYLAEAFFAKFQQKLTILYLI